MHFPSFLSHESVAIYQMVSVVVLRDYSPLLFIGFPYSFPTEEKACMYCVRWNAEWGNS